MYSTRLTKQSISVSLVQRNEGGPCSAIPLSALKRAVLPFLYRQLSRYTRPDQMVLVSWK
jgi:hypothetical protein